MPVVLRNNAVSRLASSLTAGATAFAVSSGEGAKFPTLAPGDWHPVTVIKADGSFEIMRCTARSGDVLTVTRAQEGTVGIAFSAGDRVELRLTVAVITEILSTFDDYLREDGNLATLTNPGTARNNLGLGNTAVATLISGFFDATAGRVPTVGYVGLGTTSSLVLPDINSLTIPSGCFIRYDASTTGTKPSSYGSVAIGRVNSSEHTQIAIDGVTGDIYTRVYTSGAFTAWRKMHSDGNLTVTAFSRTLLDDTTEAAARATLGAPAGVDKQMCKAWVNFNGTGTPAIRDSHNVSSITDNGVGDYSINFATALANANYAPTLSARAQAAGATSPMTVEENISTAPSTTSLRIIAKQNATPLDSAAIHVHIFGG